MAQNHLQLVAEDMTLPVFQPCPTCTQLVAVRLWRQTPEGTGWVALDPPLTPVLGMPHGCPVVRNPEELSP